VKIADVKVIVIPLLIGRDAGHEVAGGRVTPPKRNSRS